ncbi:ThiF family adenylyltransferase [Nocardia sp. NPDC049149]|uniref:ThiF family adenylyltransferase n=1 Tax=Nocardia sp. NPDC049149 TaxID=3364315 RepID=UPI00371307BF
MASFQIGRVEQRNPVDLTGFRAALGAPPGWAAVIVAVADGAEFAEICREHHVEVLDTVAGQVAELARIRLPGEGQEREQFIAETLAGDSATYGCWAYLPWTRRVVHVLGPDDFFDVLTDRNQDKITRAEQQVLRGKCVGVLGLSVGGEAAVTLAQEHLCGHIVLADFDALDLSNLNRLNASVADLGVPKAWIVARRIAEIDPYLHVTVFDHGVTAENADAFLEGLDLLVEECDDLPTKYDMRTRAKARGLDVVYAADERGFLSVEPYRTEPALPVFHGLVDGRPARRAEFASTAGFLRSLTGWLGGWGSISSRSRRSVEQVGRSLSGYPQLASEARFAAGQVGHVARRLLLGEQVAPFHDHVDLAQLVP